MAEEVPAFHPRCMNVTCKSMLVYGEAFESDPDYQAGMVELTCVLTARGQGPDGDDVTIPQCSNPERACYREF